MPGTAFLNVEIKSKQSTRPEMPLTSKELRLKEKISFGNTVLHQLRTLLYRINQSSIHNIEECQRIWNELEKERREKLKKCSGN